MMLSREALNSLKVLNPWRTGFMLIFLANLIFHSSPALLLLLILAAIFGYAFFVLSRAFLNYARGYSQAAGTLNEQYTELVVQYKQIIRRFFNLRFFSSSFRALVLLTGVNILTYRCLELPNAINYGLLELGVLYGVFSKSFLYHEGVDLLNIASRNSYLQSSLELIA